MSKLQRPSFWIDFALDVGVGDFRPLTPPKTKFTKNERKAHIKRKRKRKRKKASRKRSR